LIKRILSNNRIRAREVRLIDENEKQIGVVSLEEALRMAQERNLDLIQVTEKVEPPVCRLGDLGKYIYREEKKEKTIHKHKGGDLKGIRLTFNISQHDLETRVHQAEKFLKRGDQVRIELPLKGRQRALQDFAQGKIEKFLNTLNDLIPIKRERELKREARGFTMIISKL
jgi:translation initiation factor IF-3